ncbi:MAG: hypothetical protein ACFE89_03325 [Candidatus Hodarchaeota archaeon]
MTEHKPYSWVKHAVRKWKQFYYEILRADGQIDLSNPLSMIFSPEFLLTKISDVSPPSETAPTKQEHTPPSDSTPASDSVSKDLKKRRKGRFPLKIKEIQALSIQSKSFFSKCF